jgi:hypothetical protein
LSQQESLIIGLKAVMRVDEGFTDFIHQTNHDLEQDIVVERWGCCMPIKADVIRMSEIAVAWPGSARPALLGPANKTFVPRNFPKAENTPLGLAWTLWLARR